MNRFAFGRTARRLEFCFFVARLVGKQRSDAGPVERRVHAIAVCGRHGKCRVSEQYWLILSTNSGMGFGRSNCRVLGLSASSVLKRRGAATIRAGSLLGNGEAWSSRGADPCDAAVVRDDRYAQPAGSKAMALGLVMLSFANVRLSTARP